jgi:AcrR family transcriptional regulator
MAVVTSSPVRRRNNRRSEQTIRKVLDAAVNELSQTSYSDLSVRAVAARADVSAASVYKYFPSKSALVAEVYLRLIRDVVLYTDVNQSTAQRVAAQMRDMALLVADDPELTSACTSALMAEDPAAAPAREKIAHEVAHRIASALGPGWPPVVHSTLTMTFIGALVSVRAGFFTHAQIADQLDNAVRFILDTSTGDVESRPPTRKPARRRPRRSTDESA